MDFFKSYRWVVCLTLFATGIIITGCNGSGGSPEEIDPPLTGQDSIGQLMDSPMENIPYKTSTGVEGKTNEDGKFNYKKGDKIIFSLGGIELPEVNAQPILTPLELFDTENIHDPRVVNFVRLAHSLDEDVDANNNILIPDTILDLVATSGLKVEHFSLNTDTFSELQEITDLLKNEQVAAAEFIDQDVALTHFIQRLVLYSNWDADNDQIPNKKDDDDDGDGVKDIHDTHPLNASLFDDFDRDGVPTAEDDDIDNDGIDNNSDVITLSGHKASYISGEPSKLFLRIPLPGDGKNQDLPNHKWKIGFSVINIDSGETMASYLYGETESNITLNTAADTWELKYTTPNVIGQYETIITLECDTELGDCGGIRLPPFESIGGGMLWDSTTLVTAQPSGDGYKVAIRKRIKWKSRCAVKKCELASAI